MDMAEASDSELTNCPSLRLPSSLSSGRRRHGPTWRSNEEDGLQQQRFRRQGQHDHDHSVYENVSLLTIVSVSIPNEIGTVQRGLGNKKVRMSAGIRPQRSARTTWLRW